MPEISVILATHNRAAFLEPCLESLCQQTIEPSRYEICLVANACTDNTPDVVNRIMARYPQHRIIKVEDPIPGLSRARNSGMKATQAPLVALIDDDGTVYPNWLELFLARFAVHDSNLAVIGGEIVPVWAAPKPEWLTSRMVCLLTAGTGMGPEPRFLEFNEFAVESNSCYRRAALEAAGNFPVELGRAGPCLLSGEGIVDVVIRQHGGRVFFDPAIILRHYIHADRLTPLWIRHRYFWQGVSSHAMREYLIKKGTSVLKEIALNLPLSPVDWQFVSGDTSEGIEKSAEEFQALGFVLAFTGIIPIHNGVESYSDLAARLCALPNTGGALPFHLRRRAFWQGIDDFARGNALAGFDLPLDRTDWAFINNKDDPSTEEKLNRLRTLGFVLAKTGFVAPSSA